MSLRKETPCDYGECPYNAEFMYTCEYWCGAEEPEDYPEDYEQMEAEAEAQIIDDYENDPETWLGWSQQDLIDSYRRER